MLGQFMNKKLMLGQFWNLTLVTKKNFNLLLRRLGTIAREQRSCSRALLAGCGMPEIASREQCQKLNQLLLSTRE